MVPFLDFFTKADEVICFSLFGDVAKEFDVQKDFDALMFFDEITLFNCRSLWFCLTCLFKDFFSLNVLSHFSHLKMNL